MQILEETPRFKGSFASDEIVAAVDATSRSILSKPLRTRQFVGTIRNQAKRPSRNKLCPCGSGEKFKACHGHAMLRAVSFAGAVDAQSSRQSRRLRRFFVSGELTDKQFLFPVNCRIVRVNVSDFHSTDDIEITVESQLFRELDNGEETPRCNPEFKSLGNGVLRFVDWGPEL